MFPEAHIFQFTKFKKNVQAMCFPKWCSIKLSVLLVKLCFLTQVLWFQPDIMCLWIMIISKSKVGALLINCANIELLKRNILLFLILFFAFFRVVPMLYGSSQTRDWIRAIAAGLCHSHSNVGSEPHLWPTPQLMITLDP